ncbi:MAG: signal peptide peptidase SppA [Planctomycetota bacterium]|nr:MAG: signal peptide peptidase SppA [Planctomycetota bacterium]
MDFEHNDNLSRPSEPEPSSPPPPISEVMVPVPEKPGRRTGWRIFWGVILVLSVLANIALFMLLIAVVALFAAGQKGIFTEEVIQDGPRTTKVAVINLKGIIDADRAGDLYQQIKVARKDKWVKGLIIRVNSPGGTISGSDQIYNEILKYRQEEEKPVVAFMQGVAASGGYYTSVACQKIIAEPTTITGSVGVMAGHFVLQELLENKLGIQPVVFKSGDKKDWPSPFEAVTDEQRQYIQEKLIGPAYKRFVQVVADGRAELTLTDVERLADGSIYSVHEALDEKLIDEIGYLDEAIELVKSLAGVEEALVVEYEKPFSLAGFLSARSNNILGINRSMLYELSTPQVLYLWSLY